LQEWQNEHNINKHAKDGINWSNEMNITAYSSHGYFVFDSVTGTVIKTELDTEFGSYPQRVDVHEYFDYYGDSLPDEVDVLDIKFTDLNGVRVDAEKGWRIKRR